MKSTLRLFGLCVGLCCFALLSVADAEPGPLSRSSDLTAQDAGGARVLPTGVRAEEVKIDNAGVKLSGTLLIPKPPAGKRGPAVLMLSGSDHHRQGSISIGRAPLSAFNEIGSLLAGKGLAVLTFDTRCNGKSDCRPDSTPHDYAFDAIAAYGALSKRAEVDPAKILIFGHDEGGVFAASLSSNIPEGTQKPLGVILVGTPGRTYGKILRDQAGKRLVQSGKTPAEVATYLEKFDALSNALSTGVIDLAAAKIDPKDPLFAPFIATRSYLFHSFVNDPLQVIRTIESPVLIVQGEKDLHVSVKDAQYLKESLARQYNEDVTLEILPDMDHWLRAVRGAVTFQEEEPKGPLDPAFLTVLNTWLAKHVK